MRQIYIRDCPSVSVYGRTSVVVRESVSALPGVIWEWEQPTNQQKAPVDVDEDEDDDDDDGDDVFDEPSPKRSRTETEENSFFTHWWSQQ